MPPPEPAAMAERERLAQRLRQLDLPFTDWTLLRAVTAEIVAVGSTAEPVVDLAIEMARASPDPRFRVRLLGVQVAIDPKVAVDELQRVVEGSDEQLAALAARVLGRSGAPADRIDALVRDRLVKETRASVRGALVLGAGEAGVTTVAPLLRVMLEKGAVTGEEVLWMWTALAQTADQELTASARLWLAPHSPLLGAAVLIARRFRDAEAERPLVRLLELGQLQPVATWIAHTLGACGGEIARKALRASIEAEAKGRTDGIVVISTAVDPRQLALLRLGEKEARTWVEGLVARAGSLESGVARMPELFGKWRLDGAATQLAEWLERAKLPLLARASAARGLCWLRDRRGLDAAAALLAEKDGDAHAPEVIAALRLLQQTLHEFVDDIERPDYRGLVQGDGQKAADLGKQWRAWLRDRGERLRWRAPVEDTEDLLLWY